MQWGRTAKYLGNISLCVVYYVYLGKLVHVAVIRVADGG